MTSKPKPYAQVVAETEKVRAAARLADPDEHFPYKLAHARSLLAENPPMGPNGEDDDSVLAEDFLSARIVEASADMIEAQAAYLQDPTPRTEAMYRSARDDLIAARKAHRRNRVDMDGNPCGNFVGIRADGAPPAPHMVGPRLRRAGEA